MSHFTNFVMIMSLIKLKFQERWFILQTLFKLRKNVQNGLSSNLIVLVESEINNCFEVILLKKLLQIVFELKKKIHQKNYCFAAGYLYLLSNR